MLHSAAVTCFLSAYLLTDDITHGASIHTGRSLVCFPPQPPPADLDSLFLYIEDVIDVSSRLLSLLDQKQVQPGDPLFLQTLCK